MFGKPQGWGIFWFAVIGILLGVGHVFVNSCIFAHIFSKNKIEADRLSAIKMDISYLEDRYDSLDVD